MPFRQNQDFTPWLSVATQALQGAQAGRAARRQTEIEDRDYADAQMAQQAATEDRALQRRAQAENERYRRERETREDTRRDNLDLSNAYSQGFIPQEQAQQQAASVQQVGQQMQPTDTSGVGLALQGAAQQVQAQPSAFSIAGQALVKGRPSVADVAREDAQRAKAEDREAQSQTQLQIAAGALQGRRELAQQQGDLRRELAGMAQAGRQAPPPKPIPQTAMKAMITNQGSLSRVNEALRAVDTQPGAFGMSNMGPGAWVKNNIGGATPEEMAARAAVADIGSQIIHDRSGAAVTISEYPRLAPFIPSASDKPAQVRSKLQRLQALIQEEAELYQSNYGPDQGFREFQSGGRQSVPPSRANPTQFPASGNPMGQSGRPPRTIQDY